MGPAFAAIPLHSRPILPDNHGVSVVSLCIVRSNRARQVVPVGDERNAASDTYRFLPLHDPTTGAIKQQHARVFRLELALFQLERQWRVNLTFSGCRVILSSFTPFF